MLKIFDDQLRKAAVCLVFAVWSSEGLANTVCEPLDEPVPMLEELKTALASGQFDAFFKYVGTLTKKSNTSTYSDAELIDRFESAFPDGFSTCTTIMSEQVSKRFLSEIVVLKASNEEIMFLGWDFILIDGSWMLVNYNVSNNFLTVRDLFKG